MAEQTECEGNVISPLGSFKKISCVSSASVVTTTTTVSYSTRTVSTLTPASPAPVISLTGSAKPPVIGGVRGYEYVRVEGLNMIYRQAVNLKKERDESKRENEKLKKMLKSLQRKEKVALAPAQADSDTTTAVSPITSSWLTMLLQLRALSSTELQKARVTIATQARLMADKREIKRLTIKVATLTHCNNQAHLVMQQNMAGYPSSTTESVFDSTTSDVDPEEEVTQEPAPAEAPRVDLPTRGDDSVQISQIYKRRCSHLKIFN